MEAELVAAGSLDDLLASGITATLTLAAEHEALAAVIDHEPELVLPHFAFHQLGRVLALAEVLTRPHLERFLAADAVGPAADLLARVVLTFAFRPASWVDPGDAASVRRLVGTYLLPALASSTATPA